MCLFIKLFWSPRKGIWYRNKKKTTLIVDPIAQGNITVVGKEIKYGDCYIIRGGKKRRGSFKVIGNKVRFIEGWKYRKSRIRIVDYTNCKFSKYDWFNHRVYKMKIKPGAEIRKPRDK